MVKVKYQPPEGPFPGLNDKLDLQTKADGRSMAMFSLEPASQRHCRPPVLLHRVRDIDQEEADAKHISETPFRLATMRGNLRILESSTELIH